ncbi:MAG: ABC transporter permease [Actinomycetota bacterium]
MLSVEPTQAPSEVIPLRDPHETERLGPYLRDVRRRWPYIWYNARSELRRQQVNTVFGNLWLLINPALTVAIFYLIFGLLLQVDRGVDNLLLFLAVGIFVFRATQQATTSGSKAVVNNEGLIRSIHFPRLVLPLTATLAETLATTLSFLVVFVVAVATGVAPSLTWLVLVPIVALQTVFNFGAGTIAARVTTHFRDTTQLLPFAFRLLFYGSGVIFNVTAYAEGRRWIEILFALNPMYCFISMARWTMLGGSDVTPLVIASSIIWSIALAVGGFFWFRAGEANYARS